MLGYYSGISSYWYLFVIHFPVSSIAVHLDCYGSATISETSHITVYEDASVHYCVQEIVYNNIIFHKEVTSGELVRLIMAETYTRFNAMLL